MKKAERFSVFCQMLNYSQKVQKQSQQECKLLQGIGGHFLLLCELIIVVSVCYLPNKWQ